MNYFINRLNLKACLLLLVGVSFASNTHANDKADVLMPKERIVAAGGSVTEILFALGAQNTLVGVDSSSLFPASATHIANVGYYRQLSLEGVMSVNPTLVVGLDSMGPSSVLTQLDSLNISVKKLPLERNVDGLIYLIRRLGLLVDKSLEAERLIEKTLAHLSQLPNLVDTESRVIFLMSAGSNGLMAAGTDTVPNLIFELLQLNNPLAHIDGFKPVSNEVVLAINPDLILIPTHQQAGRSAEDICQLPSLALWANGKGCHIKFVDSLSFLGITPRLPEAALKVGDWLKAMEQNDA